MRVIVRSSHSRRLSRRRRRGQTVGRPEHSAMARRGRVRGEIRQRAICGMSRRIGLITYRPIACLRPRPPTVMEDWAEDGAALERPLPRHGLVVWAVLGGTESGDSR